MDEVDIKICPECGAEFYPHVEECSDCGVALAWRENLEWEGAKMETQVGEPTGEGVAVRQGSQGFVNELSILLTARGIANAVRPIDDCGPGKCASTYALMVEKGREQDAVETIEAYYREQHPELALSDERVAQDKCPACGFYVGPDAQECRDCGLPLVIEEQAD
jgi:uncharacterized OB-fold protein